MTTRKNLVKSMLMSILTAGIFCFSFSSCDKNDELLNDPIMEPADILSQQSSQSEAEATALLVNNRVMCDTGNVDIFNCIRTWMFDEDGTIYYIEESADANASDDKDVYKGTWRAIANVPDRWGGCETLHGIVVDMVSETNAPAAIQDTLLILVDGDQNWLLWAGDVDLIMQQFGNTSGGETRWSIFSPIKNAVKSVASWFYDRLIKPVVGGIKEAFKYILDKSIEVLSVPVNLGNKGTDLLCYVATVNEDRTMALKVTGGTQQSNGRDGYGGLFDTDSNTHWYVQSSYKQNGKCWFVEFQSGGIVKPLGFILTSGKDIKKHHGCNPKNWKLYGKKNKGDKWTVMYTANRATDGGINSLPAEDNVSMIYPISNPAEYQYFRLEITENWGDNALMLGGFAFAY